MLMVMTFMLMIMAFVFMIMAFVFMIVIVSLRMLVVVLMIVIVIVCGLSGMARTAGKQISAHYAYPIYFLQHVFCY